jgi:hypothetical protein
MKAASVSLFKQEICLDAEADEFYNFLALIISKMAINQIFPSFFVKNSLRPNPSVIALFGSMSEMTIL